MDFNEFVEGSPDVDVTDPIALYETLDREQSHVELRPGQKELLKAWAARRTERDVVLKLATGAGKTTVGLLILYSHMRETQRPCLFLCPTNQLVEQVEEEGRRCGVPCVTVTGGAGEIPPEALAGEAVLITSVQNVFQVRSGHFAKANFYAVLVDDAHAAVEIVRDRFRLRFFKSHPLYSGIHSLVRDSLKSQNIGAAAALDAEYSTGAVEVPYWTWLDQLDTIAKLLSEEAKAEDAAYRQASKTGDRHIPTALPFTWGFLSGCLQGARCVYSEAMVEIAPEVPPVDRVATYDRAEHRIFMSATISDESVLVRELACDPQAAENPIELGDAGGIGERMILVPRLMAASKGAAVAWPELAELCRSVSTKFNVVVLTPSYRDAVQWSDIDGAHIVTKSADVPQAVRDLRRGTKRLVVFANRYDGIDLPDGACRLLVLHGAPMAQSLVDSIDATCRGASSVRRRAVMRRIEQGLGRSVRSPSDYSAIILFGNDLVSLVSHVDTRGELTDQTRRQVEFGLEIAKQARQGKKPSTELETLISQCLMRDPGWKKAYQKKVKLSSAPPDKALRKSRIAQAKLERTAWEKFINNQGSEGAIAIQDFLNATRPNDYVRAFLLQRAAWYMRKENPTKSLEWQRFAREHDAQLLLPPSGVAYAKRSAAAKQAAAQFLDWMQEFEHENAAIAAIDELGSRLIFSPEFPADRFEQGLCDLGRILGLDSSRPDHDYRVGPDVLWMEGQNVVPLEAKNNIADETTAICKHDAGQLSQSVAWASATYPERGSVTPLIAHPCTQPGESAILPTGTRVLTPKHLGELVDALRSVVTMVCQNHKYRSPAEAAKLLHDHALTLPLILARRTDPAT